jgi:tetratricopeptide (TPR) repeat protein
LLGAELKRQGGARLEEALSHYQTALTLYPDYVLTHPKFASNLGSVLLELGRTTEAIDLLEQAVALNPHWSTLHYSLGYAYERSGKMTDARTSYLKALRASPDNPRPYAGLASLFLREAHYGQALQAAEAALRRDPQYGEALSIKARALQALRQHEMETGVSLGR